MIWAVWLGVFLPFVGTALGAATVFLVKDGIAEWLNKLFLGFAAGVMLAAAVWSLILPSAEFATEYGLAEWLPPLLGVSVGFLLFLCVDGLISRCLPINGGSKRLLFLSVTFHNVPEGMAVGVSFARFLSIGGISALIAATSLSVGISLQNFPEGAIISLPLKTSGKSKRVSFLCGVLSGLVEPIFALLTIATFSMTVYALPWMLSLAAGAMLYVVVEELIPEAAVGAGKKFATVGIALGFILMMTLDMALG